MKKKLTEERKLRLKKPKNISMQKKMTISFAVPIALTCLILNMICYHYISAKYEEKLHYSTEQSSVQAQLSLNNYVLRMQNLAELIARDSDVQMILSSGISEKGNITGALYRKFYQLREIFVKYEMLNIDFRVELFVPSGALYGPDQYYFYEYSFLENRDDYDAMMESLDAGKNYFTLDTIQRSTSSVAQMDAISMYTEIRTDEVVSKRLAVLRVSFDRDVVGEVLQNATVMAGELIYLMEESGRVLADNTGNEALGQQVLSELEKIKKTAQWSEMTVLDEDYYVFSRKLTGAHWYLVSFIPKAEYEREQNFIQIFLLFLVLVILVMVALLAFLLSRNYVGRLKKLRQKMEILEKGDLNALLPVDRAEPEDEIEEVYKNFNFMVEEVKKMMQEHYRLGKEIQASELRALQAQINPHFLYNTLDLINWMAMDYGATEISSITWDLSRFYRLSLNKGKNIISVREELEHVKVYVDIENVHFDGAISYCEEVPEELRELACLNIVLQPFVENSILHGMYEHAEIKNITIRLSAKEEEGDIIFCVLDDGMGMKPEEIHNIESNYMKLSPKGYGVRNINFRLKLCFGEKYGVFYEKNPEKGTKVYIRIPRATMEEAGEWILS